MLEFTGSSHLLDSIGIPRDLRCKFSPKTHDQEATKLARLLVESPLTLNAFDLDGVRFGHHPDAFQAPIHPTTVADIKLDLAEPTFVNAAITAGWRNRTITVFERHGIRGVPVYGDDGAHRFVPNPSDPNGEFVYLDGPNLPTEKVQKAVELLDDALRARFGKEEPWIGRNLIRGRYVLGADGPTVKIWLAKPHRDNRKKNGAFIEEFVALRPEFERLGLVGKANIKNCEWLPDKASMTWELLNANDFKVARYVGDGAPDLGVAKALREWERRKASRKAFVESVVHGEGSPWGATPVGLVELSNVAFLDQLQLAEWRLDVHNKVRELRLDQQRDSSTMFRKSLNDDRFTL